MRKVKIAGVLIGMTFFMTGCGNEVLSRNTKVLESVSIEREEKKSVEYETIDFNLGGQVYKSETNKEMPYNIQGIISVPKIEEKMPVVFLIHGSHDNENTGVRFDTGFKYITEYLAQNGYISISLDVQNAYVWKYGDNDDSEKITEMVNSHLNKLKEADEGREKDYKVDLKNKIDFENIGLIGHSRGGETIFKVANDLKEKGQNIKSLISIAPTAIVLDTPFLETDIDTGIIVPEYDGDVIDLSGIEVYDVLTSKERENFVQFTYLEKANHNYFNNNINRNDTESIGKEVTNQLSKEEQQIFLKNYILDFLNLSMKNEKSLLYDMNKPTPSKAYGCDIKTLYTDKNTKTIIDINNIDKINTDKSEIEKKEDAIFFKNDKSHLNSVVGGREGVETRSLLEVEWSELNSKISFIPNIKNFESHNSISFNIVQDPSSELNNRKENKVFTIQIKDKKGNISNVELNNESTALKYIDGELESMELEGEIYENWSEVTPITELRIPLKNFEGVNLKEIEEVSLIFDKEDKGNINIGSIQLK